MHLSTQYVYCVLSLIMCDPIPQVPKHKSGKRAPDSLETDDTFPHEERSGTKAPPDVLPEDVRDGEKEGPSVVTENI